MDSSFGASVREIMVAIKGRMAYEKLAYRPASLSRARHHSRPKGFDSDQLPL
jgi:hypothetical protein